MNRTWWASLWVGAVLCAGARGGDSVLPRLLEGDGNRRAVSCIELDPRCSKVWLAVGSAPPAGAVTLTSLRVDLLIMEHHPRSAVGVIYQNTSELPVLMRELIEHHDHYRATARDFAVEWQAYHNAGRLIEDLQGVKP